MIVQVDTREQLPYSFERFPDVEVITEALPAGDYSLPGFEDRVAIERKSIDDLVQCLMNDQRDRFERELQRASHYDLFAVVVEATLHDVSRRKYRSQMNSHAALQSIMAFQVRYRVPFMFCGDRAGGEYVTHSLLEKYLQELSKRFRKATKSQGAV